VLATSTDTTGARAKAWCLLCYTRRSVSLSLPIIGYRFNQVTRVQYVWHEVAVNLHLPLVTGPAVPHLRCHTHSRVLWIPACAGLLRWYGRVSSPLILSSYPLFSSPLFSSAISYPLSCPLLCSHLLPSPLPSSRLGRYCCNVILHISNPVS